LVTPEYETKEQQYPERDRYGEEAAGDRVLLHDGSSRQLVLRLRLASACEHRRGSLDIFAETA